jgi:hypothetical protein
MVATTLAAAPHRRTDRLADADRIAQADHRRPNGFFSFSSARSVVQLFTLHQVHEDVGPGPHDRF